MDKKAREDIGRLSAKIMALKEVLASVLSREAKASPDPKAIFSEYSTDFEHRLHRIQQIQGLSDAHPFLEAVRLELDSVLAHAQDRAGEGRPPEV